jgi:hypothetical protein
MAAVSIYAQKAISKIEEIANPKDRAYWLAGGELRNSTLAGGSMFDVLAIPAIYNLPRSSSQAVSMNSGTILEYLNTSYMGVLDTISGSGFLDLMNDYTLRSTVMLYYSLTITTTDGSVFTKTNYISSSSGGDNGGSDNNGNTSNLSSTPSAPADLEAAQKAMNSQFDLMRLAISQDIVSIGFLGFDIATGKIESFEVGLAGGLIGSINSIATREITGALANALGTTSIAGVLGIGVVVGAVLGELMEMAMGLDSQFGYGGEFIGYDATGKAHYAEVPGGFVERTVTGIKDMFGELGAALTGGSYSSAAEESRAQELDTMRNSTLDTLGGLLSTAAFDKNASKLQELNAKIGQTNTNRFGDLSDLNTSTIGWAGSTTGYTTTEEAQRSQDYGGGFGSEGSSTEGAGNTSGSNESQGSWSCFVAGTSVVRIINSRTIKVPIETIKIGDKLLGFNNHINEVLGYDCPLLGDRQVFGINNAEGFVTSEHPLLTTEGWKVISPEALEIENKELFLELAIKGKYLKVGDRLITINGEIPVLSIVPIEYPACTQLYNFKLDGNRTYYANGIVVHNK